MTRRLLLPVLLAAAFAVPAQAQAYVHLAACESSLRGGGPTDNDVHNLGVLTGASSFGGWGVYWRTSATNVYVYGRFNYPGGIVRQYLGHCWSYDYGPDTIG